MAAASGGDDGEWPGKAGHARYDDVTTDPEDVWLSVLDPEKGDVPLRENPEDIDPVPEPRSGWKTVRVFVSSTFDDFHYERDMLIKRVFPDLKRWCEKRRLHFVDCDLRWGVPKDSPDEKTLRACMEEIDRCKEANKDPFFISLTSERVGWVPRPGQVHEQIALPYRWVFGLSLTEMEIVHGAYRDENPNALFLIRMIDENFIKSLPKNEKKKFKDYEGEKNAHEKLKILKRNISERFSGKKIIRYKCSVKGKNPVTKQMDLNIDSNIDLEEKIKDYLKNRIRETYPDEYIKSDDPILSQHEQHEAFMNSRIDFVLGREKLILDISALLTDRNNPKPLLLVGEAGSGKTSVLAMAAKRMCAIADSRSSELLVFYHFVGAVPKSTDLTIMLQRLASLLRLEEADENNLSILSSACLSALSNPNTTNLVVIIDAINQFDEETEVSLLSWLPQELPPSVHVLLSAIRRSQPHIQLMKNEHKPIEMEIPVFNLRARKNIIKSFMSMYHKELTVDQMVDILDKEGSENPLWLGIACEELRIWGELDTLEERIEKLPNNLLEILELVFKRYAQEMGDDGYLIRATLCLLETSRTGLRENELLELLQVVSDTEGKRNPLLDDNEDLQLKLPSMKWHDTYRLVGPFLRPYGESGEGRLDFFHRILSKLVRTIYMVSNNAASVKSKNTRKWWHNLLAAYFEKVTDIDRHIEEYPYHLIKIGDKKKMETFLCNWEVFYKLFDEDLSVNLLKYWRETGDSKYDTMDKKYSAMVKKLPKSTEQEKLVLVERYLDVAIVVFQAGKLDKSLELVSLGNKMITNGGVEPDIKLLIRLKAHFGSLYDQKIRTMVVDMGQVPLCETSLTYFDPCIEMIRGLPDTKENKILLGRLLLKRAAVRVALVDVIGYEKGGQSQGMDDVTEAYGIFTELKYSGRQVEALLQKAALMNKDPLGQLKINKEALDQSLHTYGKYHFLTAKVHRNTGICAEDIAKYANLPEKEANSYWEEAYTYFKGYYEVNFRVFGKDHPATKEALAILKETEYREVAKRLKDNLSF